MASVPSQFITTFNDFKRELEVAFKSITDGVNEQLNASDAPLTLHPDSLVQFIKQYMPPDKFVVQRMQNPSDGLGPYFDKLPRELRDQIFSDLIASGHPAFMRTSNIMEQEGKALITKEGIYRLNFGFAEKGNCPIPNPEVLATIQKVEFHIRHSVNRNLFVWQYLKFRKGLGLIEGLSPQRKTCNVFYDLHQGCTDSVRTVFRHLDWLEGVAGVEKVILHTGINLSGEARSPGSSDEYRVVWQGIRFIRLWSRDGGQRSRRTKLYFRKAK